MGSNQDRGWRSDAFKTLWGAMRSRLWQNLSRLGSSACLPFPSVFLINIIIYVTAHLKQLVLRSQQLLLLLLTHRQLLVQHGLHLHTRCDIYVTLLVTVTAVCYQYVTLLVTATAVCYRYVTLLVTALPCVIIMSRF